jgi:AbrB family transcriptional regulator (stage V sporulation protein T)
LHKTSGHITCISDRDTIIAVSGASKKEFLEKSLSQEIEKIIEDKTTLIVKAPEEKTVNILADEGGERKYFSQVVTPIISEGDPIGAVMFLSTDPDVRMGEVEAKLAQTAAGFLGKQMEQ